MRLAKIGLSGLVLCLVAGCNGKDAELGEAPDASSSADGTQNESGDAGACTAQTAPIAPGLGPDSGEDSAPGPAYCFACGSAATCDGRSQVCENTSGGAPPGVDLYQCIAIPAACASNVTCACVAPALHLGVGQCTAAGKNLTLYNPVP